MLPYLLYYLCGIIVLLFPSKFKPLFYTLIWFIFIGFRNGIGVDYFSTIKTIERQVVDFSNISISFQGYNLLDAEIIYKVLATILFYLKINSDYVLMYISLIESFFIFYIIKTATNKNLIIIIFLLVFSIHYPMNAIRQGFCLISLIFANNFFKDRSSINSILFYLFSLITHYASLPIVLLSRLTLDFKKIIILTFAFLFVYKILDLDTLMSRYSIDQIDAFTFKGNGLKLYLFTSLFIFYNYFVIEKKLYDSENILIILLFILTIKFNPFFRLYFFFLYYKIISDCYKLNFSKISDLKKIITLLIPVFLFLFEWQEVFRFQPCLDCGDWFPYKSLLF